MTDLFLQHLSLYNFKNYEEAGLDFSSNVVVFAGSNGSGKTNLLDAIYYLSTCKSYFNPVDSQNILFGNDQCSITGDFRRNGHNEQVVCSIRRNQKKVMKRNFKDYERLAEHIGLFPSVMITPYDIELIWEGSEIRRKFVDATLSQVSKSYLEQLTKYNHALVQRNNLLKTYGRNSASLKEVLEPWDYQLADLGTGIFEFRKEFLSGFQTRFVSIYKEISGFAEEVNLIYKSDLHERTMAEWLEANAERDRILERTAAGIHRDDLEFTIHNQPLKKFASQGQQKTFLFGLKLAQYVVLSETLGIKPILMLDDLFDKMDYQRLTHILDWLAGIQTGQIFITDTHEDRIPEILNSRGVRHEVWQVKSGKVSKLN